jgi:CubicO group peptidase (beta-lactamase class C family)
MRWPRQSAGLRLAALFSLLFVLPSAAFAQASPAQPLDPITAIVNAFKTHDVVALDEGNHGNEQGAAFRKSLYHDARFLAAVNDIVVESGNGRHQAMMDRYIAGGDVPEKGLRMAWLETTQPNPVWDRDIYADMFRTIREINQKLPKAKQLRVLLGDAPYTYDPSNPGKPIDRPESFPANLILHEVIAKKRKALIVYGGMHYLRRGPGAPPVPGQPTLPGSGSIVNQLENAGVKVFSIWTFTSPGQDLTALQADIASWPKPSLTLIKDTTLGVAPFTFYYPKGLGRITRLGPNGPIAIDLGEEIGGVMQEQFDALLYLGPKSEITYAGLQKSLCADPDYVEMRANRLSAMRPPGAPATGSSPAADAFRLQCKEAVEGPRTTASPGTEAVLRRIIDGFINGQPDFDEIAPDLVNAVKAQSAGMQPIFARLGALTAITFKGVGPGGADIYEGDFEHGQTEWRIAPLGADGKVAGLHFRPAAPGAPLPPPHPISAQPEDQSAAAKVDALFNFNDTTPGCAVGIEQNGKTLLSKGYGMADLAHGTPITPQSTFYMASVSKQFTAMTILLLAEKGRLRLTDSVRKFIPELPRYADTITIYQLLTHTSGIRDYLSLGYLAGLSPDYVYTDDTSLRMIARQAAPSFVPGSEYLYSNSGYFLLSLVVKKVTGKPLDEVARAELFDPLGMKFTRFSPDHTALIPNKASGYEPGRIGLRVSNSMLDVVGDGGLYSSIDDMMLWMRNFDSPTVGADAIALMKTPGRLNSGTPTDYGMGLMLSEYRGLKMIEHGGSLAGYQTEDLWFPQERFSVVVLCNNKYAIAPLFARQIADIYLAGQLNTAPQPVSTSEPAKVSLLNNQVLPKAGTYRDADGDYEEFSERDGSLYSVSHGTPLDPLSDYQFAYRGSPNGSVATFDRLSPSRYIEKSAKDSPPVRYDRADAINLSDDDEKSYVGNYDSSELGTTYHVTSGSAGLSVAIGDQPARTLRSTGFDRMLANGGLEIIFVRDGAGKITGFTLNAGRVRNLQFQRITED